MLLKSRVASQLISRAEAHASHAICRIRERCFVCWPGFCTVRNASAVRIPANRIQLLQVCDFDESVVVGVIVYERLCTDSFPIRKHGRQQQSHQDGKQRTKCQPDSPFHEKCLSLSACETIVAKLTSGASATHQAHPPGIAPLQATHPRATVERPPAHRWADRPAMCPRVPQSRASL